MLGWLAITSDVCLQQFRAAVTVVLGYEFPSPKVVSERAKTDTFGCRNTGKIYDFYEKLFAVPRRVGNSGTGLLISTAHKLRCSSILLSNCYQPEQLKTRHIFVISHYILHPVIIHSLYDVRMVSQR